jgi:hypothetical protein
MESAASSPLPHVVVVRIPFLTPTHARYCIEALSVDEELQPGKSLKTYSIEDNVLVATLSASEKRLLRVVAASFFDAVSVVTQTLSAFGEPR